MTTVDDGDIVIDFGITDPHTFAAIVDTILTTLDNYVSAAVAALILPLSAILPALVGVVLKSVVAIITIGIIIVTLILASVPHSYSGFTDHTDKTDYFFRGPSLKPRHSGAAPSYLVAHRMTVDHGGIIIDLGVTYSDPGCGVVNGLLTISGDYNGLAVATLIAVVSPALILPGAVILIAAVAATGLLDNDGTFTTGLGVRIGINFLIADRHELTGIMSACIPGNRAGGDHGLVRSEFLRAGSIARLGQARRETVAIQRCIKVGGHRRPVRNGMSVRGRRWSPEICRIKGRSARVTRVRYLKLVATLISAV